MIGIQFPEDKKIAKLLLQLSLIYVVILTIYRESGYEKEKNIKNKEQKVLKCTDTFEM